jgi:hypothetical protein
MDVSLLLAQPTLDQRRVTTDMSVISRQWTMISALSVLIERPLCRCDFNRWTQHS